MNVLILVITQGLVLIFLQSFETNQSVLTSSVKPKFINPLWRVQYRSLFALEDGFEISRETPVHNYHYVLRNNKENRRSHRQQYGTLLNWNKLKLKHNKNLCQGCNTESIYTFTSQVHKKLPLSFGDGLGKRRWSFSYVVQVIV